jgi:hypothetical protein
LRLTCLVTGIKVIELLGHGNGKIRPSRVL